MTADDDRKRRADDRDGDVLSLEHRTGRRTRPVRPAPQPKAADRGRELAGTRLPEQAPLDRPKTPRK